MKFIIWHLKKDKKKILTGSSIPQMLKCHLSDTDIDLQFETKYIVFCANKLEHPTRHFSVKERVKSCLAAFVRKHWVSWVYFNIGYELGSLQTQVCSAWTTGWRLNEKKVKQDLERMI